MTSTTVYKAWYNAFLNSFFKKEFLSATPKAATKRNKVRGHV